MKVAIPKEVKNNEFRVAITPAGVHDLVAHGHTVTVQTGAGTGSSIPDADYVAAGATISPDAASTWAAAELLLKVKEPIEQEFGFLRHDLVLFTYLHLAAEPELTQALLQRRRHGDRLRDGAADHAGAATAGADERGCRAVGADRRRERDAEAQRRPRAAGPRRARHLPGESGRDRRRCRRCERGRRVRRFGRRRDGAWTRTCVRLAELDSLYAGRVHTIASNGFEIERALLTADLVIGSVLIPGAKAPKLVSNDLVSRMKRGSVLVDIAVDQGGCFADSHPTTHEDPTFMVHGSLFYCVANMPGAVPNTSTYALTNATMPYVRAIANLGWKQAMKADAALARGLNTHDGHVTNPAVANAHHLTLAAMGTVLD